ncbi:elongation factor Ts [Simkania negevensis]|uniref:Elongation factor Ts n=1 Tax=Simkania negevensis TaxID=83561 RepID=A0ABS3ASF3_9BACT|nr:elongation factor Ts [Simkania negevensis]
MPVITLDLVKELRGRTGIGIGKCKAALEEAAGDIELAIANLRKAGMTSATKKAGRETNEGLVGTAQTGDAIAMIEVNSETDFVARNERFLQFVHNMALEAAETKPVDLASFIQQKNSEEPTLSNDEVRAVVVQTLGENIQIGRCKVIERKKNCSYGVYSHMNGRIVVLVELEGSSDEEGLARDIGMHIAAEAPDYLSSDDVPAEVKAKEEDIARSQIKGKPENIMEKILIGKMKAFYDQACLLQQKFVKNSDVTVQQLVESRSKELGKPLKVLQFLRWEVGEEA